MCIFILHFLYILILSLTKGLCSISKENRDAIRLILKELQQNHYLEIEKVRGDKGYFEYNYLIY